MGVLNLRAGDLDTIGVTVLRQVDPSLTGGGVKVAQPEGGYPNENQFEVDPGFVSQPAGLFTYISTNNAIYSGFPNSGGLVSGHANVVGDNFYGVTAGVATNVNHVDNYAAGTFFSDYIYSPGFPLANPAQVVNQSFIFDSSVELLVNTNYDNYAAKYGTLFVSAIFGANNAEPICAPGTCYNGIGVGGYGFFYLPGPTTDGRCKPDIVVPDTADGGAISYATPYVAGSAAVMLQAANRGDGGANTNAAGDLRTVKALLLNGAVKPADWTNGAGAPLDARYGAGMLNLFNSWIQLKGGQHAFIESTTNYSGGAHPPGRNTNNEPVLAGWDYGALSTKTTNDVVKHYYFNLPGSNSFALTATLVWTKHYAATGINNLNLFLYNAANSNLVTCSTSLVDNVEHVYVPSLSPGRYDLQVLKPGSAGQISASETNALAFEIFNLPLSVRLTNDDAVVSWPVAPSGFALQSAAGLQSPVSWMTVTNPVAITTNQCVVTVPLGGGERYFRLMQPSF